MSDEQLIKRRVINKMIEKYLSRHRQMRYTSEYDVDAFLNVCKDKNRLKHKQPDSINVKSNLDKDSFKDMQVFRFNFGHHVQKKILYIPGGFYALQPSVFHWRFMDKLAYNTLHDIVMPIYPKLPDFHYQETYDAIKALYFDLVDQVGADNIIIMGDSSGGTMALSLTQQLMKENKPLPHKLYLISPWLDATMANPAITESLQDRDPVVSRFGIQSLSSRFGKGLKLDDPILSPLNGQFEGLPPIYLFAGSEEINLPDYKKLQDICMDLNQSFQYYEYPKMIHSFPLYPITDSRKVIKQIKKTL
ncbi:alpha/beta hydrolase [Staphylococcus massiliensis]|uniref:alpha/beta hydrolase n=1 Tax=Staphylococcus massiliensis TaxID=555791 RepID=UPI003082EE43